MKGILITAGAALLVAVPAATGLIGNTSFAQSVPVRVPSHATLLDDSDSQHTSSTTEPGDDKGGQRISSTTEPGDDKGGERTTRNTEPGDDKGGERTTRTTKPAETAPDDTGSGKGQNGGQGGSIDRTGGKDDGSGHA